MIGSASDSSPRSARTLTGWVGYALAVAAVAVATAVRSALDPVLGDNYPFSTYFGAVAVVAWWVRTRPSVAALLLSGGVSLYLFLPPRHSLAVTEPGVLAGLILFLAVGGVMVAMGHARRVALRNAERLLAEAVARREEVQRAADAEAEQKERLRTTLESITDAFSRFDKDWRITCVNAEAERLTGRPRAELLGRSHWEAFPAALGTVVEAEYRRAVAERVTVEFEHHFEPLGRWFAVKADPTPDGGLAVFFRDITDRKRADGLLAGQTRVLELVASDAPLGDVLATLCRVVEEQAPDRLCSVLLLDDDGTHLRVGAGPGLPDAYVRHLDGLGIGPPYHGPCGMALHTGQAVVVTDARTDGRWPAAWRELVAGHGLRACRTVPVAAADGTPLATFAVYRREPGDPGPADPTVLQVATHLAAVAIHRKRAEEELRRRAEEMRVLLDTLPVGVLVAHDPEARTITGNRAATDLLRTPARNLSLTAPPDEQPTAFKVYRNGVELPADRLPVQRAARGEVVVNEEVDVVFADGGVVSELISAAPLYDAAGRVRGAVAGVLDISTRKATERRLRDSEAKYRTLFESMDEGYCVIEVLFDPPGGDRAVDYRFLEVNPAFAAQSGLHDAAGRRMLELAPSIEDHWLTNYGRVARTGEPVRFANEYKTLDRWFDVYAFRLGGAGSNRLAVLFTDISDRRRAEEVVRASEERLRTALAAARMVAWEWTPADGRLRVSENAADVFGLPAGVGLTGIEQGVGLIHPDDVPAYRATFQKAIAERGSYLTRYRLVRPDDGRVVWIEEQGHTVCDQPGGGVRLFGVAMDVTGRVRAEEEVRDARRRVEAERGRLAEVFRQAPAFLCVLRGPEHVFELANDRYEQLVGHRPLLGRPVREALPEVEEQGFVGLLDAVYRTGEPFVGSGVRVLLARQPDQPTEERYVDFVYQALRDPGGAITGVVTVGVDVTDRRQAEVALARLAAESERQRRVFDTALSNTPDATYTFDLEGRFTFANHALLALLGRGLGDVIGRTVADLGYPPALADRLLRQVRRVIDTRQPVRDETPYTGVAGEREYEYVFVPVVGAGGAVEAVVGSSRDITDRKRAEAELRRLAADLSDADRRKDEFLATLAHELRNPLAPIRNGLQVIKLAGATGTVEQARSMMDRQVTHLVRLVDDLLDVSRITRGKMDLRSERVELRAVIDAAVETARPAIDQAGHELVVQVPDEPVLVDGDATRLAQVVSNLLTNSAKYTHRGGHVRLAVRREGEAAVVSVTDDGIGIPPAMLDKVFVMFAQVDRTLEKTTGGLGIGLSLVKGLVEMHGGTIAARSEGEGRGSEFVVTLPVAVPVAGGPGVTGREVEAVLPSGRRRVLVVDDNADAADSLAQLLELMGNEVRTANDGEAGVAAAAGFRPDLIFMDLGMPKLNGYEACRGIRAEPWGTGVVLVALTGWGQEDDRRKTAEAGFDHHLVKPVEFTALTKLLSELTTGRD